MKNSSMRRRRKTFSVEPLRLRSEVKMLVLIPCITLNYRTFEECSLNSFYHDLDINSCYFRSVHIRPSNNFKPTAVVYFHWSIFYSKINLRINFLSNTKLSIDLELKRFALFSISLVFQCHCSIR